jgi:hypothetical protein
LMVTFQKNPCEFMPFNWYRYPWVMYMVLAVSALSFTLNLKSLVAVKDRYEKLRRYYSRRQYESEGCTPSEAYLRSEGNDLSLDRTERLEMSYKRIH